MNIRRAVEKIEISDIRKIAEKLQCYENTINLTIGEPDLDLPQEIKEAVAYHALNSRINYSPVSGLPELKNKIAKFYNENFCNENYFNGDNVIVTVGSTEGIASSLQTILENDDEVLIPTPAYVGYEPLIKMYGARPKFIDLKENSFNLTGEILEKNISEKTKAIILTYPNNPSGMILDETEMKKIVELLKDREIFLISDEIYASIVFEKYTSFAKYYKELKKQLIILNGFSKSHSMTGYRVGYVIVNEELQAQIKKVSQYKIASASTLSQYAAITALDKCQDISGFIKVFKERAAFFVTKLEEIGFKCLKPKGAFYIFASYENIEKLKDKKSLELALDLLDKVGLGVVPGSSFKVEGYIRFSIVHDIPILKETIERLEKYIKQ